MQEWTGWERRTPVASDEPTPAPWRLLLFLARRRLPHAHILAGLCCAALLVIVAGALPAVGAGPARCALTVWGPALPASPTPLLARVTVRAAGQLVATAERLDGTDQRSPARFVLACGDYDVIVDGDAGGGVGRLVTTAVRLDRDRAITLDLR